MGRTTQKSKAESSGLSRGYGLALLGLNLIIAGVFWWQLPPEIPLFYSLPYGVNQLAHRVWFLLLPGFSVLTYVVGRWLMQWHLKSTLFAPMMGWLQTLCLFLVTIVMMHIVLVTI